ncbi:hypothetical protein V6N13_023343 [Hibiscus sabdariffa]|uniref:Uncharacterized protein n=2 Tax=Hibiscus sabdariffa TaxID=183260 RepID=A0ABR2PLJ6_9ROSI
MFPITKKELAANFPDWANIPGDILTCIADMAHSIQDRVRMTAVCRSWKASLVDQKLNFPPCLMLTKANDKYCFYDMSKEEIFAELDLPEIRGRRCWGSPFGWLVTCGPDLEIQLFNPLSKDSRPLPSLCTLNQTLLEKLILSSNPEDSGSDCMVLAIYSELCFLAFAKPGDQAWTRINDIGGVDDAIYFKGNVYACRSTGEVVSYQDSHGTLSKANEFPPPSPVHRHRKKHLFDLGGNLCLASENITVEFEIFKLDTHTKSWEKLFSLGDNSLFLGNRCTFAVAAADHPGCRPNCIYFRCVYYKAYITYICQEHLKLDMHYDKKYCTVYPFPFSFSPLIWIIPQSQKRRR